VRYHRTFCHIRKILIGMLLLTGAGCATVEPPNATVTSFEAAKKAESGVSESVPPSPTASSTTRPALRTPFLDSTFGTTIMRVTDPSMAPSAATSPVLGLRHEYARFPALNADNTLVALRVIGGADRGNFEIRDLASGNFLSKIKPRGGDPEMSWHPTSPHLLFYRSGNEVEVFHTDSGRVETLMDFPQYYVVSTRGEGRPSDDWHYYTFLGATDPASTHMDIVVADLVEKRIVAKWSDAGKPDWVSMSPSGKYVVIQWTDGHGTRLYDRDSLSYIRTLMSDAPHSDFAFDAQGSEVLVYHATSKGQIEELGSPHGSPIAQVRLADGKRTKVLDLGWNWFTPHFSGIASRQRPGWVLVSTYTTPENEMHPYAREVFWLKLDGSGELRHIAHHHSDQVRTTNKKDYWAEPQATSSWDGNIVLFSSVWGAPFQEYDLYTATGHWW
jgi:hypothetical protein